MKCFRVSTEKRGEAFLGARLPFQGSRTRSPAALEAPPRVEQSPPSHARHRLPFSGKKGCGDSDQTPGKWSRARRGGSPLTQPDGPERHSGCGGPGHGGRLQTPCKLAEPPPGVRSLAEPSLGKRAGHPAGDAASGEIGLLGTKRTPRGATGADFVAVREFEPLAVLSHPPRPGLGRPLALCDSSERGLGCGESEQTPAPPPRPPLVTGGKASSRGWRQYEEIVGTKEGQVWIAGHVLLELERPPHSIGTPSYQPPSSLDKDSVSSSRESSKRKKEANEIPEWIGDATSAVPESHPPLHKRRAGRDPRRRSHAPTPASLPPPHRGKEQSSRSSLLVHLFIVHRCHHRWPTSLALGYLFPCLLDGGVWGEEERKLVLFLWVLSQLSTLLTVSFQSPASDFGLFCRVTCIVKAKRQCTNTAWGQKATLYLYLVRCREGRYCSAKHSPFSSVGGKR
ncbi:uncharacterized protein LOC127232921 [Phodopus roborovskii]|uniref:uncharacterized protein LOC127232921 n=1 Tax=Phodopus roborovskii TaxID=109678 RepID=UPI0021E40743|nr:uncharacterized protein LOC127232921 [Phodopus roborovskii]